MTIQSMATSASESDSTLMSRLKEATAEHHRKAEKRNLQRELAKGTLALDVFVAYLGELLHLHRSLETSLTQSAAEHPAIASVFRPHCSREADLLTDLAFHDAPRRPANVMTQKLVADFEAWARHTPLSLLGALYVLEGSGNGNRLIARVLSRNWSLQDGLGLRYMDPYGDEQPKLWSQFREDMNTAQISSSDVDNILAAAQRTFDGIAGISDVVYQAQG